MDRLFTIGTLAKRAGVNIQTIRYYERRKILPPAVRKGAGYKLSYRFYDEGALKRLRFIRRAQELGFTLEEIKELLDLRIGSKKACEKVKGKAEHKLKTVEEKIKDLTSVKKILEELVQSCDVRRFTEECPILKAIEEE